MKQLSIKRPSSFPLHLSVPALPGEIITNKILHFYPKWYYYLIQITHKTHFVLIFDTLPDTLSNCFIFQLPAVKLIGMLDHCANTGTEMLFPFIESSVNNVLLHTNLDFTSCFLNS